MKTITKHRQTRFDKKENEKELLSLWKKKWRLMESNRALAKVELPKPERWGYKKFFILREDIAASKEANFFKGILNLVQSTVLSRNKKFERKDYKTKKMIPVEHNISPVEHRDWNKLLEAGKLSQKQMACFEKKWIPNINIKGIEQGGRYVYEFNRPWMFVSKIEPHYITHRIVINPQLESELQEISNKIETNHLTPKISKIMGWTYNWKDYVDVKNKILADANDKLVKEELHGFIDGPYA